MKAKILQRDGGNLFDPRHLLISSARAAKYLILSLKQKYDADSMRLSIVPQLVLLAAWTISRCCLTSNHHRYNNIAQCLKQDYSCFHFFWGPVTDASLIGNQALCYVCLKHQNLSGFSLISFMSLPTTIGVNIISSSKLKLTNTWKFHWSGARSESGPYLLRQLLG